MTKDRLRKYMSIKQEAEQIRQQLAEVEAVLYSPKIPRIDRTPSAPVDGNPQENLMLYHIELQELYQAKLADLTAELLAIEKAIAWLDPTPRMLLRYRYIEGLSWEQVCVKINYAWSQTHHIHANALKQLDRMAADTPEKEVSICTSTIH